MKVLRYNIMPPVRAADGVKDFFTRHEFISFEKGRISAAVEGGSNDILAGLSNFTAAGGAKPDVIIKLLKAPETLRYDGYRIKIPPSGAIEIHYADLRALGYALDKLDSLVFLIGKKARLLICVIDDYPCFKLRGIIEGFYGTPYSAKEHKDIINTLKKLRMNTFMYAPKDDIYHRDKWREPYPHGKLNEIADCAAECEKSFLDFFYCISPGKDINALDENDFDALEQKTLQLYGAGIRRFALLLDDIDYKLSGHALEKFLSPGKMHSYIANRYNAFVKAKTGFPVIMCPTEYFQNFSTPYRNDLKENMDPDIAVFWTGYNTVAEVISETEGRDAGGIFGHPMLLWDNYPVNDFRKRNIFLGALTNRSRKLYQYHEGMVVNPMPQWYASKIAVFTAAAYMWDSEGYNAAIAFKNAVKYASGAGDALYTFADACGAGVPDRGINELYYAYLQEENYKPVDKFYAALCGAIKELSPQNSPLIEEIRPLFEYYLLEAEIYGDIKSGGVRAEKLLRLSEISLQGNNTFLKDFIVSKKLAGDIDYSLFKFDAVRENYWKI